MFRSVVNFWCTTSVSVKSRQRRKFVQRNCCVYGIFQATPQASQANSKVTFNGQWLAENISDNIDNPIEIGLSARGIVTNNHSANVNAFSALKNIQFRIKLLFNAPSKQ